MNTRGKEMKIFLFFLSINIVCALSLFGQNSNSEVARIKRAFGFEYEILFGDKLEIKDGWSNKMIEYDFNKYKDRLEYVMYYQSEISHYSSCDRCGLKRDKCSGVAVNFNDKVGIFSLCEYCWRETTVNEKIFYYKNLFLQHMTLTGDKIKYSDKNLKVLIHNIKNKCGLME